MSRRPLAAARPSSWTKSPSPLARSHSMNGRTASPACAARAARTNGSSRSRANGGASGGRRMAEQAAYLVDHVLPHVPVRQWVLTLPYRLRYLLAWNHTLCRAVLGVAVRAVLGFYRRRARRTGMRDGRSGAVTVIQRFGGGLQLNIHFHTLLLDGVFAQGEDGSPEFHAAEPPSDEGVARLLGTIYRRVPPLHAGRRLDVAGPPAAD